MNSQKSKPLRLQLKLEIAEFSRDALDRIYEGKYDIAVAELRNKYPVRIRNKKVLEVKDNINETVSLLTNTIETASQEDKKMYEDRIIKLEKFRSEILKVFKCTGREWVG